MQHAVSDIPKQDENTQLSTKNEPQEYDNIDSEIGKKQMYVLDKLIIDDTVQMKSLTNKQHIL